METKKRTRQPHSIDMILPQAVDVEMAVLGTIMISNAVIYNSFFLRFFHKELFYNDANGLVCEAIKSLLNKKEQFDFIIIANEMKKMGILEEVGGAYYLTKLSSHFTNNFKYSYHILIEHYIRRKIIQFASEISENVYDVTKDVFTEINNLKKELNLIDVCFDEAEKKSTSSYVDEAFNMVHIDEHPNMDTQFYPIKEKDFDDIVTISPDNVTFIAGESSSGKSRYVSSRMFKLLKMYDDVAICWHAYEDSPKNIILGHLSFRFIIPFKVLQGKTKTKLDIETKAMIDAAKESVNNYDIEFVYKEQYVKDINVHFENFCKARPNKFCILVIDNIMLLKDNDDDKPGKNQTSIDDIIARGIKNIFNSTKDYKRSIICLHHYTKDAIDKEHLKDGYRPIKGNMRGSSRYSDIATQLLLINRPFKHQDLVNQYKGNTDVLNNLFIVDVIKNRDGKEGIIRSFCNLDYNIFMEINAITT